MIQSYLNFLDVHPVVTLTAFTDYLCLILYYNHCLHRWKRHGWEYWQRHESIRHGTIWLFVSVAHFELVVLLSHSFTVIPKSWAYNVVQSTRCFVLKWETACMFSTCVHVVGSFLYRFYRFCRHHLSRLNVTFFADVPSSLSSKAS